MARKRERTVGDVVTAAVRQGKAIDFRFVPMSAEDERKLAKMSRAGRLKAADEMTERVFGPILKELGLATQEERYDYPAMWERIIGPIREKLGLNKEEPMGQYKPVRDSASIRRFRARARKVLLKRPKVQLVTDLEAVMHDSLLLRDRIRELEQAARAQAEESDESQTQYAAAWLARQYVLSVRRACGPKYDEKMEEEWADLKEALQRLTKSERVGIALIDGEEIFYHISGRLTPDTAVPFAYGLEELARVHGEEVVKLGGAAYLMRCILAAQKRGGK